MIEFILTALKNIRKKGGTSFTVVAGSVESPPEIFIDGHGLNGVLGLDLETDKDGKLVGIIDIQVDPLHGFCCGSDKLELLKKFPWLKIRVVPVGYDPPHESYITEEQ